MLVEGAATVSQITITDLIENYPGIPDGINGFDLMQLFKTQALKFGLEIMAKDVSAIKRNARHACYLGCRFGKGKSYNSFELNCGNRSALAQPGDHRRSGICGKGVSYCATCDGPFYRNKDVIVVGGGDTAIQEALFLTHFAEKVSLFIAATDCVQLRILQKRAFAEKKIEFVWNAKLAEVSGRDFVTGVKIADVLSGKTSEISAEGVFIFVGRISPYRSFS